MAGDCFDEAAGFHQVNPWVLRAIAAQESTFNANALHVNSNGSVDIGMNGTNSVHLPELAKFGISQNDLLDPCKSIYVAAWQLKKKVRKYGNTWAAIGAYHSETPQYRDAYASKIRITLEYWSKQGLLGQARH